MVIYEQKSISRNVKYANPKLLIIPPTIFGVIFKQAPAL